MAKYGEIIAGFAALTCKGNLLYLAVDKKYERRGIGTALMNELFSRMKGKNVKQISLHARTWNAKAVNFYLKIGFKIKKTQNHYYSNGDDAFLMLKKI